MGLHPGRFKRFAGVKGVSEGLPVSQMVSVARDAGSTGLAASPNRLRAANNRMRETGPAQDLTLMASPLAGLEKEPVSYSVRWSAVNPEK